MAARAPQLFDVLSSGQLKWALQQSLPQGTTLAWQPVGSLPITAGEIAVMDAGGCHPRYLKSESKRLAWPYSAAEIWVQFAVEPGGRASRVMGVAVLAPGATPGGANLTTAEACTMAIDSATALVADWGRLQTHCKLGGPLSRALLGKTTSKPEEQASRQQALELLQRQGFAMEVERWERSSSVNYCFSQGLSDAEIARADAVLAAAGSPERVFVSGAQTDAEIGELLNKSLLGKLDAAGSPMLVAFHTGFGDGIYYWDALKQGERVVGYACSFRAEEEPGESGGPGPAAAMLPADPASSLARERQGFLVAVLWKPGLWMHAKALAGNDREGTLLLADGNTRVVPRACLVGIPDQAAFQVGHQVLARWQNQMMYPGTITAASPQGYTIAWHDGDTPLVVPPGGLTYLEWCQAATPVSP